LLLKRHDGQGSILEERAALTMPLMDFVIFFFTSATLLVICESFFVFGRAFTPLCLVGVGEVVGEWWWAEFGHDSQPIPGVKNAAKGSKVKVKLRISDRSPKKYLIARPSITVHLVRCHGGRRSSSRLFAQVLVNMQVRVCLVARATSNDKPTVTNQLQLETSIPDERSVNYDIGKKAQGKENRCDKTQIAGIRERGEGAC